MKRHIVSKKIIIIALLILFIIAAPVVSYMTCKQHSIEANGHISYEDGDEDIKSLTEDEPAEPLFEEEDMAVKTKPEEADAERETGETPAEGRNIYVPEDYVSIQEAIDAAKDGDTVIVSPGYYEENITFKGKRIILRSTAPEKNEVVNSTVIDGKGTGPVVSFTSFETNESVLQGFTITGGYTHKSGGGIFIQNASPSIKNNRIIKNQAMEYGGGVYILDWSSPVLRDNEISYNISEMGGGGVALLYSLPVQIKHNHFEGNRTSFGSALYLGPYCAVILGDPDQNSYGGNGVSNVYRHPVTEKQGGTRIRALRNYDQVISQLGEPLHIDGMGPGMGGYEVVFYYDGLELVLEGPEPYSEKTEQYRATVLSYRIYSEEFIAASEIRVGDPATAVIATYRYDEDVDYKPDDGWEYLYYEEFGPDDNGTVTFAEGMLFYDLSDGGPIGMRYSGGIKNSCGGHSTYYEIKNGVVDSIEIW